MGEHRKTRREKRKQKKIIVISALSLLLLITVGYAAFSTNLSITAKGNIKDKSRIIQSWDVTSQTDFHSDFYKQNIVSVTFLDNATVPSNATESWNVSEDKKHGGVMAWVIPSSTDNTKYDLYIGAKDGVIANEDSSYLFYDFQNVKTINFNNNFNTSNVLTMRAMFRSCLSIETIDISSFDTSNVTNMQDMFAMWDSENEKVIENQLTDIIFGDNFNTNNLTTITQMFIGCNNLKEIDVSDWNTSKITNMYSAFAWCTSLKKLDLSKWDTSNVVGMDWMFMNCHNLQDLNVSTWDTRKVTRMRQMFAECISLTNLNLCSFDTKNVTVMYMMFYHTAAMKQIKVGNGWTMQNVTDSRRIFDYSGVTGVTTGQC